MRWSRPTRRSHASGGSSPEWLVVGLGNPGPKYAETRHNAGFTVVEALGERLGAKFRPRYDGLHADTRIGDVPVALLLPLTYMNLSGQSVKGAMRAGGLRPERVLVVHDEIDLPMGTVRVKQGGGLAGHNGLKSIAERVASQDFPRVRVGIGRPAEGDRRPVAAWVLTRFDTVEDTDSLYQAASEALELVVARGVEPAMNVVNAR